MIEARTDHACTLLPDGRVLVTGGSDGLQSLRTAEVYDPRTDKWSVIDHMAVARAGHSATLTSWGTVLIAGGEPSGTLEVLDSDGKFHVVGRLTAPRDHYAVVTLPQRKVLLAGGSSNSTALAAVDIYDVDSGSIRSLADMLTARRDFTASALDDGTVLLAGGYDQTGRALASTEIYDPTTGTSIPGPAMTGPRATHQAYKLGNNGQVLIVGGTDGEAILDSTELYVPWDGLVRAGARLPASRVSLSGSSFRTGALLIAGGRNNGGFLSDAAVYSYATVEAGKPEYAPGETAVLKGQGWKAGETVLLRVIALPADRHRTEFSATVQADGNGRVQFPEFSIDQSHLGVRFLATATGSEYQAQTSFGLSPNPQISITYTPTPLTTGAAVTVTATLTGTPTPGGIAQLVIDHVSVSGSVALSGGAVTFPPFPGITAGTHTIGINYSGDANYALTLDSVAIPAQNPITVFVIDPTTTSITLTPSASQPLGSSLTISGHVAGTGLPTVTSGNVQITVDSTAIGTVPVNATGDYTFSYSGIGGGTHTVTALYQGNSTWGPSSSLATNYQVTRILPPVITITTNPTNPTAGTPFTVTLTLTGAAGFVPGGQAQLVVDHVSVTSLLSLSGGSVSTVYSGLTAGPHVLGFNYTGDANYLPFFDAVPITGNPINININKANQVITVTSAAPASAAYNSTFAVAATAPGGVVSIGVSGSCSLAAGTVTMTGSVGTCTVTFSQAGSANYNAAPDVVQTTAATKAAATLTIVPASLTTTYDGTPKSVTVTTTPPGLSTVTVTYNGSTTPPTAAGSYPVLASLSNALYQASDALATLTISKISQTITVTSSAPATASYNTTFPVAATAPGGVVSVGVSGSCTISSGTVTMTTGSGSCLVTFSQPGDSNYSAAPAVSQTTTATKAAVSLSAPSLPASSVFGQSVTISTTLTVPGGGTPTGTITFLDGVTVIGTAAVSGAGPYSISISSLGGGLHNITTSYSGDTNFSPFGPTSASGISVGPATATAAISGPAVLVYGQSATFVATFSGVAGSPVGGSGVTVAFRDGASTICAAAPVLNGSASCATTASGALGTGPHSISVASLSGDSRYILGAVTALGVSVSKAVTSTQLSGPSSPVVNQGNVFTAQIAVVAPGVAPLSGTVSFTLNGSPVSGCQNLAATSGSAGCSITIGQTGGATIVASYSGDANTASSSATLQANVSSAPGTDSNTSLRLTSNNQVPTVADPVTFRAEISQGSGGVVRFFDGTTLIGTVPVVGGQALLTLSLAAGGHNITAVYEASGGPVNSNSYNQYVYRIPTNVTLAASELAPVFCSPSTLQAKVTVKPPPGFSAPTGQVQFVEGATVIGTATLTNGVASLSSAGLGAGAHSIAAVYLGDANWNTSRSSSVPQAISQAPTTTSVVPLPDVSGAVTKLALTAKIGVASLGCVASDGTVQFIENGSNAVLGTAPVVNGVATTVLQSTNVGRLITGVYSGTSNFVGSTSAPAPQLAVLNGANFTSPITAADSIMTLFSSGLSSAAAAADKLPLPTSLAGASVTVKDSLGTERLAQLFYVSPTQINLLIPSDTASGTATITVTNSQQSSFAVIVNNSTTSAGLFAANANGKGVAAAQTVTVRSDGSQTLQNVATYDSASASYVPLPIDLGGPTDQVFAILYGTGLRYSGGATSVSASINGVSIPVLFAGAQPSFVGLDQINIGPLPASLKGSGTVNVQILVNGQPANTVTLAFK